MSKREDSNAYNGKAYLEIWYNQLNSKVTRYTAASALCNGGAAYSLRKVYYFSLQTQLVWSDIWIWNLVGYAYINCAYVETFICLLCYEHAGKFITWCIQL